MRFQVFISFDFLLIFSSSYHIVIKMERLELVSQAVKKSGYIYDYIIVGAGVSGIQAADILTEKPQLKVLILEAQSTLGGRIGTIPVKEMEEVKKSKWAWENIGKINQAIVEKGATWIEKRHYLIIELCKRFGITIRQQYPGGQTIYLTKQKPYFSSQLLTHPQFKQVILSAVKAIEKLAQEYNKQVYSNLENPSQIAKKLIKKYDGMTIQNYLHSIIPAKFKQIRDLFDNFFQHSECIDCSINSMHELLTKTARSNDLGILTQFLGMYDYEQSYLVNGGTQLLINKFKENIQRKIKNSINKILRVDHQVITIDNRIKDSITVICENSNKNIRRYTAKKVICAIPLAISRNVGFTNLSQTKSFIIDNQLRSNSLKSFVITKTPFWRKKGSKQWANGDTLFSSEYHVNMSHDISPNASTSQPIDSSIGIMVFFHHGKKLDAWQKTFPGNYNKQKKEYFINLMSKMYSVKEEDKTACFEGCIYHQCSYMDNQFIRSGFQSITRPGTFGQVVDKGDTLNALYRDENGITFVGSEYSLQFASYMEGALRITRQKVYKLIGQKDPLSSHFTGK